MSITPSFLDTFTKESIEIANISDERDKDNILINQCASLSLLIMRSTFLRKAKNNITSMAISLTYLF